MHMRPVEPFRLIFAPLLLCSSYVSTAGWLIDSAGMSAALSGLYAILAWRRRPPMNKKWLASRFSPRAAVRGAAIGLGALNFVSGSQIYLTGDQAAEESAR